jgi:hypothetical protein
MAGRRGSLRQGRWRPASDVEGGGAGGGSVSVARQLKKGCGDGLATVVPARCSGG